MRGTLFINAVRAARENNSHWVESLYLFDRCGIAFDLAVNAAFTNTPRNKLVILSSEIEDYTKLICHI